MGQVSNTPPITLEDRVKAITKAAKSNNLDLELWFSCTSQHWGSNYSEDIRPDLGDLLALIEEDLRDFGVRHPVVMEPPEPPVLPEEPAYKPWKP